MARGFVFIEDNLIGDCIWLGIKDIIDSLAVVL